MDNKIKIYRKRILNWYYINGRNYPWRYIDDPYKVWVSESLLQKTDSNKALKAYLKIIEEYPDMESFAFAKDDDLKNIFSEIGLFYRAHRMREAAEFIMEFYCGNVPLSKNELLNIKGIGEYIASAIMCFAYNEPCAVVDVNVVRIIERVFNFKSKISRIRNDEGIWKFANKLIDLDSPKDYNYAVLDFSSLICKAKNPLCLECTLNDICCYYYNIKDKLYKSKNSIKK